MKLKKLTAVALAAAMTIGTSMTSLAAGWQQDTSGWRYQNNDNSYPTNGWQWIDGTMTEWQNAITLMQTVIC